MPIIKSAIKRVRQQKTRAARNLVTKNHYKSLIKEFSLLIQEGKIEEATALFPKVQKAIDLAVKKNLLHQNTAARRKSSLAKLLANGAPKAAAKPAKKSAPNKPKEKTK